MSTPKMPSRKRKPPPLHVSLHLIELERLNVAKRTQTRIDILHGRDQIIYNEAEVELPAKTNGNANYCIIASCLFLLLVLMNLLFLQWMYYKVLKLKQL